MAAAAKKDAEAKDDGGKGKKEGAKPPGRALSGPEKAALWLLSIDEDLAVEILGLLNEEEVRLVGEATKTVGKAAPDELEYVHSEFLRLLEEQPLVLRGSDAYLNRIAGRAFGQSKAADMFAGGSGLTEEAEASLNNADVDLLTSLLRQEHPQVIAAVLANMESERSAEVFQRLPDDVAADVVMRIATLTKVPRHALMQAERALCAGLPVGASEDCEVNGVRAAATILNQMDGAQSDRFLEGIAGQEEGVAKRVRQAMFTFEDLNGLDSRGFQTLLKEVSSDQLKVALKTASESLQNKIFGSLSKRASAMLRDDLLSMGPVRVSDVEVAQAEIVGIALQLRNDGKLAVGAGGGDDFV